ncbi:PREDICTED: ras-related protein Rab-9A-like, partial [Dinoponera quadriceps]|uniref:Ras-related protein Rab-9A-like n=1 Tax=Dinoponera quadriceps TaxID=609295 RepID=A0A6P3Y5R3_DINQU
FGEVPPEYKDIDICLLMYAANDLSSFENVKYWISKFKKKANIKNADTFTFGVVGNKQDVPEYARLISKNEVNGWCWNNNLWHSEISTKEEPTINRVDPTLGSPAALQSLASRMTLCRSAVFRGPRRSCQSINSE